MLGLRSTVPLKEETKAELQKLRRQLKSAVSEKMPTQTDLESVQTARRSTDELTQEMHFCLCELETLSKSCHRGVAQKEAQMENLRRKLQAAVTEKDKRSRQLQATNSTCSTTLTKKELLQEVLKMKAEMRASMQCWVQANKKRDAEQDELQRQLDAAVAKKERVLLQFRTATEYRNQVNKRRGTEWDELQQQLRLPGRQRTRPSWDLKRQLEFAVADREKTAQQLKNATDACSF
ncbi:hypothetical protein PHYPSEUDO_011907 [Phytophthora pseudosyringae]|uniref:Uncharacterized protein n=1 Tax=Phytophthora pseudosyringae TaxID=221518 RepID=A0A8T1W910_9STRA|nr:hypothetical protein PHYPSEUDO_011907 [Phytophthora pseudosyringae]